MTLLVVKNKKKYPLDFIEKLKIIFKHRFILLLNSKRLNSIEEKIRLKYNISKINLYNICINSIENSIILESNDDFTLVVDPTYRINSLKVATIFKYMNDGDLETSPYPIFTEIRNYIELNLDDLLSLYLMGIIV